MKTVIIYDQCYEAPLSFYVVDGDYSELNGVYGNSVKSDEIAQGNLFKLVFNEDWTQKPALAEFPVEAVKAGAIVIVAGFIP